MPRNKKTPAQFREFLNHPDIVNFQTARFNRMVPNGRGKCEVTVPAQGANNLPDRVIVCDDRAASFFSKYHFSYIPDTNQVVAYLPGVIIDGSPVTLSLRNLMEPNFYGRDLIFKDGNASDWSFDNVIFERSVQLRRRVNNVPVYQHPAFRRIATQNPTPEGIAEMRAYSRAGGEPIEATTETVSSKRHLVDIVGEEPLRVSLNLGTLTPRLATFLRARGLGKKNQSDLLRWLLEVGMDNIEASERHRRS